MIVVADPRPDRGHHLASPARILALCLLALCGQFWAAAPAAAGTIDDFTPHEAQTLLLINEARAANGLVQLQVAAGATDVARNWSRNMITGGFRHNPYLVYDLRAGGQSNASAFAENIAFGYPTAQSMFDAYMASPSHRANILSQVMRFVGIGSVRDSSGRIYNTMDFTNAEDGTRPRTLSAGDYFGTSTIILGTAAAGSAVAAQFGATWAFGTPLACDWNGDGIDTIGFFDRGLWRIPASNAADSALVSFGYGNPSDQPVCGDWNRDGIDTIGIYRFGVAHLRDTNSTGNPSVSFGYGNISDRAVVGDFNGDGRDTIGVRRGDVFHLSNSLVNPVADLSITYGLPTDRTLIADTNGDGIDTIGVHRGNQFYFSSSNTRPDTAIIASFGNPTDTPLIGDFDGDGSDDKALYRR